MLTKDIGITGEGDTVRRMMTYPKLSMKCGEPWGEDLSPRPGEHHRLALFKHHPTVNATVTTRAIRLVV